MDRKSPCQDRCGYCVTPNGWIVAAVADGVSASPLAEEGAEIAVRSCREYFSDFLYSPFLDEKGMQRILYDCFNYALRQVKACDEQGERIPYARYTTLQVLIYGERIGFHYGQAGDGAMILRDREGRWRSLAVPMKHPEEENSPVTLQDGPEYWAFGSAEGNDVDGALLTTDGLGELLTEDEVSPEIRDEILRLLMLPPDPELEAGATDAYYHELFFGPEEAPAGEDTAKEDATESLRSVTDDLTVLLMNNLWDPSHETMPEHIREEEQNPPAEPWLRQLQKSLRSLFHRAGKITRHQGGKQDDGKES